MIASRRARAAWLAAVLVGGLVATSAAQVQMPDPSLIHGKALPAGDLQTGTVTVRVVREAIGNNVTGQQVRMTIGDTTRTATTDEQGRAEFKGLPAGGQGRAEATVDGEALASDPLVVPASGGLRVILVAGLAKAAARKQQDEAAAAAAPPVKGTVTFGPNSRVVLEYPDDQLRIFYILDVVNSARTRVDIGGPLVFDLPQGAAGAAALEGSVQGTTVSGARVTVPGPFASGVTSVQIGFELPFSRPSLTFEQKWPVPLEQVTVASQKLAGLSLTSPQFSSVGDIKTDDGQAYMLASGATIPAGGTLAVTLDGLPVHSRVPRTVALVAAGAIIGLGIWLAMSRRSGDGSATAALVQRRTQLLTELTAIEERARRDASSARDRERRPLLMAELERIYGELDDTGRPEGGGEGVAA